MKDFHLTNMEGLGAITRAGEYGNCDEMNMYIASFVCPEIAREHPELEYNGTVSVHATLERMMNFERKKLSAR